MPKGNTHPYVPSAGMLVQTFNQLRKMFPTQVDAETLKRLSLAPKNESVVMATLKFLGFVDDDGNKTEKATEVFLKHTDKDFASALEQAVRDSYSELFAQAGDDAWTLDRDSLIGFFRVQDETSALTAKRQAITFEALSTLSGHGETPTAREPRKQKVIKKPAKKEAEKKMAVTADAAEATKQIATDFPKGRKDLGLTVRIEINLPAQGDQETYDRIFESIRKNLLDG